MKTVKISMNEVDKERLEKYFTVTWNALEEAKKSPENIDIDSETRRHFIENVERYLKDAEYFEKRGEFVDAFAALNYAHGLLDGGVLIGVFDVENDELFAFVKSKQSSKS